MTVALYIEPLDTLFFRDSRSFTAGEDTFGESTLPSPLTMYGAIGSYYLDSHNHSLDNFMKGSVTTKLGSYSINIKEGVFTIKGPFLCFDREPYFPAPANLWVYGDGKSPLILKPYTDMRGKRSDLGELHPVAFDWDGEIQPCKEFITIGDMQTYLSGGKKPWRLSSRAESDFFLKEGKVGHQINASSRTVKEGMLYSVRHLRFRDTAQEQLRYKKASLLIVIDSLETGDFTEKTYCIGGERRGAIFTPVETSSKLVPEDRKILNKICEFKRFFIYLVTSGAFKGGWCPEWPSPDFDGVEMVSAAVNKPQYISGWVRSGKGAGGQPRPIKRLTPAGSIYFFKADGWNDKKFHSLYKKYHFGESLSDEYPDAGFGVPLIGVW